MWKLLVTAIGSVTVASAQVNVLTYHNDNARTGQNLAETILTPSTVNTGQFAKLFSLKVDGYVYAQPLYAVVPNNPGKGSRNLLFVATEHDSVYAFDADAKGKALWKAQLAKIGGKGKPVKSAAVSCSDLTPEIGITSTPVIDLATQTIYVLAKSQEKTGVVQRLHALDLTTGAEKFGGPVTIEATVSGTGDGSVGEQIAFDPLRQHQRAALLLVNGVVYIAWASHCDVGAYHGWVMGYDAATLQQTTAFITTPDGGLGGIWMAGGGLSADAAGDLYCVTGNGTFNANTGGDDYGDSILKLTPNGNALDVAEYFTPFNQQALQDADLDLGSGGVTLLPDVGGPIPQLLVTAGKEGTLYLADRNDLGGFNPVNNSQIVQTLPAAIGGLFGTPAFWNGFLYTGGDSDNLKAFTVSAGQIVSSPASQSSVSFSFPGTTPSVSANGTDAGIVWAIQRNGSAPAILRAFDATDLSVELYNSSQNKKDALKGGVKFAVPTVANGKVYVGGIKRVDVFGLRAP